jgi:hypothetical protein
MKVKCPDCEDVTMELKEGVYVCSECDTEITEEKATEMFEEGIIVAEAEEKEVKSKKEDEDEDDSKEDDSDDSEEEEAEVKEDCLDKLHIMLSEYDVVAKILRAGKKDKLSEEWMLDLIESLVEGTDINEHKVEIAPILEWAKGLVEAQAKISEDLVEALSKDESLSEDVKIDVVTVFEAAVSMKTKFIKESIQEEFDAKLAKKEVEIRESVENEIDGYLDTVVSEWMIENKLAVERGIKTEMVESFMAGLHTLFVEHNIDVPEGKEDVLESLAKQVEGLESTILEMKVDEGKVMEKLVEMKSVAVLESVAEGLAETSKEKLVELAESVEFVDEESYGAKLQKLKESFLSEPKVVTTEETEEMVEESDTVVVEESQFDYIAQAAKALARKS